MHYADLQSIGHGGDISGAALVLGEISAVGPEALTLRSAVGTQHGFTMVPHDFVDACKPGQFAIIHDVGERWALHSAYDSHDAAAAALPEGILIATKCREEKSRIQALRAEHQATKVDSGHLARAQTELAAALTGEAQVVSETAATEPAPATVVAEVNGLRVEMGTTGYVGTGPTLTDALKDAHARADEAEARKAARKTGKAT